MTDPYTEQISDDGLECIGLAQCPVCMSPLRHIGTKLDPAEVMLYFQCENRHDIKVYYSPLIAFRIPRLETEIKHE